VEAEAILVNPGAQEDQYYKVKMMRNGDIEMLFDVVSTSGATGTIPFGPSNTKVICTQVPLSVASAAARKDFESHTKLDFKKGTLPNSVPGKWKACHPSKNSTRSSPDAVISWQYYDQNHGGNGWHNYKIDPTTKINSNALMEQLFVQHQSIPDLPSRIVQSGQYSYLIDFRQMKQTNQQYKTQRNIRRLEGEGCSCQWCRGLII
jgi:hypothetical protein